MGEMVVRLAETRAELERIAPVLLQLRPSFDADSLVEQIERQQAEGYRVAYVEWRLGDGAEPASDDPSPIPDRAVLCVAGFVVGLKLAWGRHIYVDDLVTDGRHRSRGAGTCMLDWLKNHGREIGCTQLHLDSGVQRFAAHRFYLREGFDISSHHFGIAEL